MSPVIFIVSFIDPIQALRSCTTVGGTTSATGLPKRVIRTGFFVARTRSNHGKAFGFEFGDGDFLHSVFLLCLVILSYYGHIFGPYIHKCHPEHSRGKSEATDSTKSKDPFAADTSSDLSGSSLTVNRKHRENTLRRSSLCVKVWGPSTPQELRFAKLLLRSG